MTQTSISYDYAREATILARYFQPGQPPMGDRFRWEQPTSDELVYLGEVDVVLYADIPVEKLTSDPVIQGIIRENAIGDGIYDDEEDMVDMQMEELTVDVSCPFAKLSTLDQAWYRLVALLVNSQGVLEGDSHEWALSMMRSLACDYWERDFARREGWRDESGCNEESGTFDLLTKLGIDLEPWCRAYSVDRDAEIPPTPPLAWVKEHRLACTLFGLSDDGDSAEVDIVLAYALHALQEYQPEQGWDTSLYLADVVICNLPTFEETRNRLAERIATLPHLHTFAVRVRHAGDMEQVNEVLRELYAYAQAHCIWVVT